MAKKQSGLPKMPQIKATFLKILLKQIHHFSKAQANGKRRFIIE
jgi:hypothetical protein